MKNGRSRDINSRLCTRAQVTRSVEYWHSHTGNMKQFERSITRGYPRGLGENCVLTEFRLFETIAIKRYRHYENVLRVNTFERNCQLICKRASPINPRTRAGLSFRDYSVPPFNSNYESRPIINLET